MKILAADKLSPALLETLKASHEVTSEPGFSAEDVEKNIANYEIVVVRSTKVTEAAIANCNGTTKMIIRAGAGYNTIAIDAAKEKGIYVCNTPGMNASAVAELAIGMMIAADRSFFPAQTDLVNGRWEKAVYGKKAMGLRGRTLGIVGCGNIGSLVGNIAKAMGMKVAGWSHPWSPELAEKAGVIYAETPAALAAMSDVITVHVAYCPPTHHFVNEEFLSNMKNGATLINTSRGAVVDTEALKKVMEEKNLRVCLDVIEGEPAATAADLDEQLVAVAKKAAVMTPHLGASTVQAEEAVGEEVGRIVEAFQTKEVLHCVNGL